MDYYIVIILKQKWPLSLWVLIYTVSKQQWPKNTWLIFLWPIIHSWFGDVIKFHKRPVLPWDFNCQTEALTSLNAWFCHTHCVYQQFNKNNKKTETTLALTLCCILLHSIFTASLRETNWRTNYYGYYSKMNLYNCLLFFFFK